jgi:hypothetical protein
MTFNWTLVTQGIRGFKYDGGLPSMVEQQTHRENGTEYYYVRSSAAHFDCPDCKCTETTIVETGKRREISGLHVGFKKTIFRVNLRRILCSQCNSSIQEPIIFFAQALT